MADIKISELGAASAVNATNLFPMTSSGVTVKATAQQIKNYIGVGNLSDLDTTDKSSAVAAINEVNTKVAKTEVLISNSGDAYSSTKAYAVGDLVIYNNTLYRCITACSAGSWATNQSCFTQDTLVNVINSGLKMKVFSYIVSSVTAGERVVISNAKTFVFALANNNTVTGVAYLAIAGDNAIEPNFPSYLGGNIDSLLIGPSVTQQNLIINGVVIYV